MSTINTFIAVRNDFNLDGLTARELKVVEHINADARTQMLFRSDTIGPNTWTVWSLYFDNSKYTFQFIRDEVEALVTAHSTQLVIAGAWWFDDGRQVGTQVDSEGVVTGTPLYPIHNRLYQAFPDTEGVTRPTSNAEISTWLASGGQDLNKLAGQADRQYS